MTVADNTSRNQYTATSGQTVFAYTFEIVDKDDIVVLKNGTTLSEGTDYTVSNVGNDNGGNVTLTVGAAVNDVLTLYRDMPYARTQNYTNSGDFLASEVNSDFDNLWLAGEQTNRSFSQSIRKPITDSDSISMELPEAASRAGKYLQFDSTGAVGVTPGGASSSLSRQQFTGDGSTTAFTLSAAPDASGNGLQIYIDGVYQESTTYSVSGSTLTFTEAPPLNSGIEVVKLQAEELGSTTSNLITYTPAGTGAVDTTVQAKLRETVSVKDFGAVGDGVTDDTAAIQAALTASNGVFFGDSENNYLVNGVINLKSNQFIVGENAKITQSAANTEIFNSNGVNNISIHGMHFVGASDAFLNSDSARSVAVYIDELGGSEFDFYNNKFENFRYTSVRAKNADQVNFVNNVVIGPGTPVLTPITSGANYGFLTDFGCSKILISGNSISKTAQGLRINNSSDVRVSDNEIFDIDGQHGIYAGAGLSRAVFTNNIIKNVDLIGIKVQQEATYADIQNIVISNNNISQAGGDGITTLHAAGSTPQTEKIDNCVISGNVITSATAYGIIAQNCVNSIVSDNSISNSGGSGVIFSACDQLTIANNHIINANLSGIRDQSASSNFAIKGNRIHNIAQSETSGDRFGIFLQGGEVLQIAHNVVSDATSKMEHGIYIAGGTQTSQSVYGNICLNATSTAFRVGSSADDFFILRDNAFAGTGGAATNNPDIVDIASAATVTLRTYQDTFRITGTTSITTIDTAGHTGHKVTLIFSGSLTVTDGSNLRLAGNFVTSANDTITLICDGSNWYETSRSAN